MYYNNLARVHKSSDLTSSLLTNPKFSPDLNQHLNLSLRNNNSDAVRPNTTILPQWSPYIFPNDSLYTTTQPTTTHISPSTSLHLPSNTSLHTFPPGWASVKLFGKERLVAPSVEVFQDPNAISLQVVKSIMNPTHLPIDIISAESQDGVRLAQSQLFPQESIIPSNFELQATSQNFIHHQQKQFDSSTTNYQQHLHVSSKQLQPNNHDQLESRSSSDGVFSSHPMVFAPTPLTFQQDSYTTSSLFSPHDDHCIYDRHYNPKQPSNPPQIAALAESAAVAMKSTTLPKDGFLYSDDNIIHSYLPHHTETHLKANAIHQLPFNEITSTQNQQKHQRYYHTVSARPTTQQNLPDDLMGFGDMVNPGGNMGTESMWVTPINMIATDSYRRLSIPTTHFNTRLERKLTGCCHRIALPGWIAKIFSVLVDINLDTPNIHPNRHFHAFQQSLVGIIYHYRAQLTPSDGNPKGTKKARINYPTLAEKLAKINPRLSHLITKNLISSIKTAFSTPISLNRPIFGVGIEHIDDKFNGIDPGKAQLEILVQTLLDLTPFDKNIQKHDLSDVSRYPHPSALHPGPKVDTERNNKDKTHESLERLGVCQTQPVLPLFGNNHASQFLFSGDDEKVKIWPFNSTALFRKISTTMSKPTPHISLAQLFAGCFSCIKTPTNMIKILNSHQSSYTFPFPSELITHYTSIYETHAGPGSVTSDVSKDLILHVENPINLQTQFRRNLNYSKVHDLIPYLEFLYSTPLFYKINPKSMYQLICCVRHQLPLSSTGHIGQKIGYSIKDYDSYGLFTALIRWSVFWESKRYVSHIRVCPILKQLKKEYLSIIKHSIIQFQSKQDCYLNQLNGYVETMNGANDADRVGISEKYTKSTKLLPLPPQFTLEIPPDLISKYLSINHFIHSINPCEICYSYREVRIVYKPWAQPIEGQSGSTNNPSAPLPTSVFDLNFFNIPLFDGFSNSSSQNNNHSTRFDLASGKIHDIMGQALSLSPETLRQLNVPSQTWSTILNPQDNHQINTRAENIPFTAIYSTQTGDFEPIDPFGPSSTSYNHHAHDNNNTTPNPYQEYKTLTNSIIKGQSLNNAYGIYIPSNLVRRALGPFIVLFPTISFTSEQLASLFAQPSVFTDYEQHFILSSREITPMRCDDKDDFALDVHDPKTNPTLRSMAMTNSNTEGPSRQAANTRSTNKWHERRPPDAYTCLLLDSHLPGSPQMTALREFEQAKMEFAQSQNEHFSAFSSHCYLKILDQAIYERYQNRQLVEHQHKHHNVDPYVYHNGLTEQLTPSPKELQLNLTSLLNRYHHNLRKTLSSQLGYRDGVYDFFVRNINDTLETPKGHLIKHVGIPTLSQFSLSPFASHGVHSSQVLFDTKYTSAVTRNTNYTLTFPRSRFAGYSRQFFQFQQWIQGEYLLSTQKYTKMSILNDALLYPYIEMYKSVSARGDNSTNENICTNISPQDHITSTHSSHLPTTGQYAPPTSIYNDSVGIPMDHNCQNWDDIDINATQPHIESLSGHLQPSLKENDVTNSFINHIYQKKKDQSCPTSTFNSPHKGRRKNQAIEQQPPTYYYTPTTLSPVSAPIVITGVTPIMLSMNKFSSETLLVDDFVKRYHTYTCLPSLLPIWNFFCAPTIGFVCGFVLFVMFGLILHGNVEPTPATLICMPILAALTFFFPFLFTLQHQFRLSTRNQSICGFSRCCGVPAPYIKIKNCCCETRLIETLCYLTTFGEDFEGSSIPSAFRFFTSFWFSWTLVSVYCRWTSLYPFSLTQIFVPGYAFLGMALLTFWHRVGSLGLIEGLPTLLLTISIGVLHGALAAPDNHHYNSLAIFAPFLLPIAVGIIALVLLFVTIVCDDDGCDGGCCEFFISLITFLGSCVVLLWISFLLLLLQRVVRPDTWWSTSYWASHFLTYPFIICIIVMLWIPDDDDSFSNTGSPSFSPHPADILDIQLNSVLPYHNSEFKRT